MNDLLAQLPSTYYRVSVKALVFDDKNRLLVFRDDMGEWEMPGGGWEHGESLEECLIRELKEEANAEVAHIEKVAFCYLGKTNKGYPKLSIAVKAELASRVFQPNGNDDIVEARFVPKAEFLNLTFEPGEGSIKDYADQI